MKGQHSTGKLSLSTGDAILREQSFGTPPSTIAWKVINPTATPPSADLCPRASSSQTGKQVMRALRMSEFDAAPDENFVYVPGAGNQKYFGINLTCDALMTLIMGSGTLMDLSVAIKAHISRQTLLKEVALSLQLTIHQNDSISESPGQFRAWIEMDLPRSGPQGVLTKKQFYSDLKQSKSYAMKDAAQAAITHLVTQNNVAIHDANHARTVVLEKNLQAARSFQRLYENDHDIAAKYVVHLKKGNEQFVLKILKLCADFMGLLPLEVLGWKGPMTQLENVTVNYTGCSPPETKDEKLATSLIQLLPTNIVAGLLSFVDVSDRH